MSENSVSLSKTLLRFPVEPMGSSLFSRSTKKSGTQFLDEADVISAPNSSCSTKKPPLLLNPFWISHTSSGVPSPLPKICFPKFYLVFNLFLWQNTEGIESLLLNQVCPVIELTLDHTELIQVGPEGNLEEEALERKTFELLSESRQ